MVLRSLQTGLAAPPGGERRRCLRWRYYVLVCQRESGRVSTADIVECASRMRISMKRNPRFSLNGTRYLCFSLSLRVCVCVRARLSVDMVLKRLTVCGGRLLAVTDAAATSSGIRIRHVYRKSRISSVDLSVSVFPHGPFPPALNGAHILQHRTAASLDEHQHISWRNICYCPSVRE